MTLFRPEVEALRAYTMADAPCRIKVNQNEAPWDWPADLKAEAAALLADVAFHRYPPFEERRLTTALEARWGLGDGSVLVGNGSNDLLVALFLSALGTGRTVLLPSPSFGLYGQLALLAGGRIVEVPLEGGVSYGASAWLEAVRRERPHLVLVCSPNNPTGAVFPKDVLGDLLRETAGLVVVDEAYAEFAADFPRGTARDYLPEADNLVVLRTFSKAWGAAALRLGYLMAAPRTALQVKKALLPYNISPVTAGLGVLALEHSAFFESRVGAIVAERGRMVEALRRTPGLTVYPSQANFLLVRLGAGTAAMRSEALRALGILVRDVSHLPGLEDCLRLSIGSPGENDAVLDALAEVVP